MNRQTKTAQVEARQAEAMRTAEEQETQARKAYFSHFYGFRLGKKLEITFATFGARKARQRYEKAQENSLAIMRQYAAILAAVPTDYSETNYIKAN